jgi:predicted ATPase
MGLAETPGSMEETFWAVRMAVQALAGAGPVAMLVEDLLWAEPTLLDLLVNLVARADGPVLVVSTARPELREVRAAWPGTDVRGATVTLEPLTDEQSADLVTAALGGSGLDPRTLRRIQEAAGGNPLFLVETVAMLMEEGHLRHEDGRWRAVRGASTVTIPATITGLLEARLDRLEVTERDVLTRAGVIGKEFRSEELAAMWDPGPPAAVVGLLAGLAGASSSSRRAGAVAASRSATP